MKFGFLETADVVALTSALGFSCGFSMGLG
jgi:hypothetical protein